MPEMAAFVDELRAVFGKVRVIYASEGGKVQGQPTPKPEGFDAPEWRAYRAYAKARWGREWRRK